MIDMIDIKKKPIIPYHLNLISAEFDLVYLKISDHIQ